MDFEEIYREIDLQELEKSLQGIGAGMDFSLSEVVRKVYEGSADGLWQSLWDTGKNVWTMEIKNVKNIFITVVIVILISALFSSFKDTFRNAQIAEISFYINYLLLITIFSQMFGIVLEIGETSLGNIEEFMRIFFPTFFLLVGSTAGAATGLGYYQIAGVVIYAVEWCLESLLLPAVSGYMLFVLMNGIWEEEKLSLVLDLFQKGIRLGLKIALGVLTGAGMLQSMIVPMMDRIKGETIYQTIEAIPGIGEVAEGAIRIWLGSAVLIKNSVGIAGCMLLIVFCMAPVIKIFLIGCFFKITAAMLSVVGDKKMIHCTNQVGDGVFLVLQTVGYGILFFVVLIAISIYTTNGGI